MAKSTYFSNSAKLLTFAAALLFLTNAFSTMGSFLKNESLADWGSRLSSLALYVVLALGYVAFNGEGVGHKRYRDRKSKKITGYLKLNLVFCFALNFMKNGLNAAVLTTTGAAGIVARVVMSIVSVVGSYGFLLCVVSLWYVIRDRAHKCLLPLELIAFAFGVMYNLYKCFNYLVVKYNVGIIGNTVTELFSNSNVLKILCLLQLGFDVLMLVQVCIYYAKKGEGEQAILDKNEKQLQKACNVYKEEGFGIDTLEDDFLLNNPISDNSIEE